MDYSLHFLLFCFTFYIPYCLSHTPNFPNAIVFPVTKDVSTLQYITHINMATPRVPIKLVVDLGGPFLWDDCASKHASSSHHPNQCSSLQCSLAKPKGCDLLYPENSVTKTTTSRELAEDIMAIDHIDMVHHFLFSCAPTFLLQGLASGAKGMLGLGRTRIGLPSQLATRFGFHRKFSICLSSSDGGVMFSGYSPYRDVSKSLMYTPIISTQGGTTLGEYYINLRSIKINGRRLSLNTALLSVDQQGNGGTKISTIVPYTTMESTIYDTFSKAYIKVANSMNMTRVPPVAPFGVCFSSKRVDKSRAGPTVPVIDLVLQSEMVKWRIYGRNSMVEVNDEVMCLGFLDGGLSPKSGIVIGGYQLEDNLLEFNLSTSMLGFSSSLLMRQTNCSNFKLYSVSNTESVVNGIVKLDHISSNTP